MRTENDDRICVRCRVQGVVQGVFYRASTRNHARDLGVTGYARNRNDGSVEVLACGARAAVLALRDWLWEGPSAASVEQVECTEERFAHYDEFSTG